MRPAAVRARPATCRRVTDRLRPSELPLATSPGHYGARDAQRSPRSSSRRSRRYSPRYATRARGDLASKRSSGVGLDRPRIRIGPQTWSYARSRSSIPRSARPSASSDRRRHEQGADREYILQGLSMTGKLSTRQIGAIVALLGAGALVAGCGSSTSTPSATQTIPATTPTAPTATTTTPTAAKTTSTRAQAGAGSSTGGSASRGKSTPTTANTTSTGTATGGTATGPKPSQIQKLIQSSAYECTQLLRKRSLPPRLRTEVEKLCKKLGPR